MKRILMIITAMGCMTILFAFAHPYYEANSETAMGDISAKQQDDDDMRTKMEELNFTEISLEVQYQDRKEYEAEIDADPNEPIEAEVEDELNNVYLRGKEAFDELFPKVKKLNLTSKSSKQEIIEQIIEAFELPADYVDFDVEIRFKDGVKKDIEDRK